MRLMTWNIAEGRMDGHAPNDSQLPRIAEVIREVNPDIVFLNELIQWRPWPGIPVPIPMYWPNGTNQTLVLKEASGMPHAHWALVVGLRWEGWKAVSILSKFPLGAASHHRLPNGYGWLETTTTYLGARHHLISLRLNAYSDADVDRGLAELTARIRQIPTAEPVIVGGDFNRNLSYPPLANFGPNAGMRHVLTEKPDPQAFEQAGTEIDHIYLRGPYTVTEGRNRDPAPNPSDHVYVAATLEKRVPPVPPPAPPRADRLRPGEQLAPDTALASAKRSYELWYQRDGNLVLYRTGGGRRAVWASNTVGRPPGMCVMQDDGNFVLYTPEHHPVFSSQTHGNPGAWLRVQDDGKIVIFSADGSALWTRPA